MNANPSLCQSESLRPKTAFNDYARNVREADVDFFVTDNGRSCWAVRQCTVGTSVVQFGTVGAGMIADGSLVQADQLLFVIQSSSGLYRAFLNGEQVSSHGIAVIAPGSDFVFVNQIPHEWMSFSIGLDRLPPWAIDRFGKLIEARAAALLAPEPAFFAELVRVALDAEMSYSRMAGKPLIGRLPDREDELIDALTTAAASSSPDRLGRARGDTPHYYAIVRRALSGMIASGKVDVGELCRSLGIGERTLRRAFVDVLKMPPLRYLKLRQLNHVHAALSADEACGQLVTDILTRHGVTELGRFAAEYRALFGENPSQTIRRYVAAS